MNAVMICALYNTYWGEEKDTHNQTTAQPEPLTHSLSETPGDEIALRPSQNSAVVQPIQLSCTLPEVPTHNTAMRPLQKPVPVRSGPISQSFPGRSRDHLALRRAFRRAESATLMRRAIKVAESPAPNYGFPLLLTAIFTGLNLGILYRLQSHDDTEIPT